MGNYRAAILGASRGRGHARAYKYNSSSDVDVVAFCDKDQEKLEQACLEFNCKGYSDYDDMIIKANPDIVHIVTGAQIPRSTWFPALVGSDVKAVLMEKPYGLTPNEIQAVNELVESLPNIMFMVNLQRRYMPFAYRLRGLLRQGQLGQLRHVYIQSVGDIMDMGPHVMDLLLMIMGDSLTVQSVWATMNGNETYSDRGMQCPDNLYAQVVFDYNTRAVVEITKTQLAPPDWQDIDESLKGNAHYPNRLNMYIYGDDGEFWWREYGSWGYRLWETIDDDDAFRKQGSNFLESDPLAQQVMSLDIRRCLDKGTGDHLCNFANARAGMELLLTLYNSANQDRSIDGIEPITQYGWYELKAKMSGEELCAMVDKK